MNTFIISGYVPITKDVYFVKEIQAETLEEAQKIASELTENDLEQEYADGEEGDVCEPDWDGLTITSVEAE